MKLESEHTNETEATPELVDAMLRDGARRGAWLALFAAITEAIWFVLIAAGAHG